jgi:hypothetical protein
MCRNIKPLFNFDPPATHEELRNASIQFVRKLSGFAHPSKANEPAFEVAIDEITRAASRLIHSLHIAAPTRTREEVVTATRAGASRQRSLRHHGS